MRWAGGDDIDFLPVANLNVTSSSCSASSSSCRSATSIYPFPPLSFSRCYRPPFPRILVDPLSPFTPLLSILRSSSSTSTLGPSVLRENVHVHRAHSRRNNHFFVPDNTCAASPRAVAARILLVSRSSSFFFLFLCRGFSSFFAAHPSSPPPPDRGEIELTWTRQFSIFLSPVGIMAFFFCPFFCFFSFFFRSTLQVLDARYAVFQRCSRVSRMLAKIVLEYRGTHLVVEIKRVD